MNGRSHLKGLLVSGDGARFWSEMNVHTRACTEFDALLALSTLRRRALAQGLLPERQTPLKLALLGGYSLQPFRTLLEQLLAVEGFEPQLFAGEYDNYVAELICSDELVRFAPEVVLVVPAERRCRYTGALTDDRVLVEAAARAHAQQLLEQCRLARERTGAEIVLANFPLPAHCGLGSYRTRAAASDWSFRKLVNLELGFAAPSYVHICDAEFVAQRIGGAQVEDARLWFESKQPGSSQLLLELAREAAHVIHGLRRPAHKVLVLDLDNTLWGGVVGDQGLEGIELGDTSPRGEAFKAFQGYILTLQQRGVLLAVCSKNDHARAFEPFEKHPEMVLRPEHVVSFKANWQPKSENLRQIAAELNLGLDSLVFVDDNPAEIEIVRQFVPEVKTILLGEDPAAYVAQLKDCRYFEPKAITAEDIERTGQYRSEARRQADLAQATDMGAYLQSLEMRATISEFTATDVPRIVQLINKSNQFNLTTRRRTEGDVQALSRDPQACSFTLRLEDKFGDHGLVVVVIGRIDGRRFDIDTWLMSCRVLLRGAEEETLNEIMRLAAARGCTSVRGLYLQTAKNGMVRELLPKMGFAPRSVTPERGEYEADCTQYEPKLTAMQIVRRAYDDAA